MSMDELQVLADLVQGLGMWAIGFVLYYGERKAHEDTKKMLIATLREVAGLEVQLVRRDILDKSSLGNNQPPPPNQ